MLKVKTGWQRLYGRARCFHQNGGGARGNQVRFTVIVGDAESRSVPGVIRNRYRRQVLNGAANRYRLFAGAKACIQITPITAHRSVHFLATHNKLSSSGENTRRKCRLAIGPGPDFIRFPRAPPLRRSSLQTIYRVDGESKLRIDPAASYKQREWFVLLDVLISSFVEVIE